MFVAWFVLSQEERMNHKRISMGTILALFILVSQFIPIGNSDGASAASRCNSAGFIADVTVPDGSFFHPGVGFVKIWRLKNTGTCTWTRAYSLAYVNGDPLGATSSMIMPTVAPGQQVDVSLDMNAPTRPGHYRGYWKMKDARGVKFGLGIYANSSFWVDINVSSAVTPSPTSPPTTTGLNLQGTVRLNGIGLAGVRIYRSYAGYSGVLVATSGVDGGYKSDFMYIPGDETITIWPELAGYTFDPANVFWRHYHSVENKVLDFTAVPSSPNPPSSGGTAFDFIKEICAARWVSSAGQLPCPSTDGDARGFALSIDHPMLENGITDSAPGLLVSPQNKYNGYIQGFFPEYIVQAGDHFQASVGCAFGSSCYVTFRLDYQIDNGAINILWVWKEKNEGMIYQLDKDLSPLAGKNVKFILTLLATGPATGDRALWGQPRILRTGYVPLTPTPAPTAVPQGNVTDVKAAVKIPDFVNCAGTLKADLLGSITTNGPAAVKYHWEISGSAYNTTAENTLVFTSASTQPANIGGYALNCGNYIARLVVTAPNAISAQTDFSLSIPTVLPIYDFNTFNVIGTLNCSDVASHTWRQEACNGESGGCWISQTPLFGNNYAGFLRHDGNTICGLNIP
jgi:hypothetical protein